MSHESRLFCIHVQTVLGGHIVSYREYRGYGIKVKRHSQNCKKKKKKRPQCPFIVRCLNTGAIVFFINKQKDIEQMKTNKLNLN
jgi:hypothetical protein